jgi:hypothetical protein
MARDFGVQYHRAWQCNLLIKSAQRAPKFQPDETAGEQRTLSIVNKLLAVNEDCISPDFGLSILIYFGQINLC